MAEEDIGEIPGMDEFPWDEFPVVEPKRKVRKRRKKIERKVIKADTPLTRVQELFVQILISKDGEITPKEAVLEARKEAGVREAPTTAARFAREWLNPVMWPNVALLVNEYRQELDSKYKITRERHIRDLQRIRDQAMENGAYSAAVQAEYRRGQAHGDIYVDRKEVRFGSIDQMSKADVLAALKELQAENGGSVIDITPTPVPMVALRDKVAPASNGDALNASFNEVEGTENGKKGK